MEVVEDDTTADVELVAVGDVVDVEDVDGWPTRVVVGEGIVVGAVVDGTLPTVAGTSGHGAMISVGQEVDNKFFTLPHSL